ncbi:MAG: segregation/condensation protein A [Microcoleaceae cyanobacterium MO_207.B10]|nr:segregation/condensation protein A [Microcoleaceae cyanobacterium MO_207.B10]
MTVAVPQVSETLSEGIALLIDLAERGEINPWDVQVIEVIDRYLSKLAPESDIQEGDDFANLSQSGQAFLYASILVWLKADSLANSESSETNAEITDGTEILESEDNLEVVKTPLKLEQQLRRRAVAPSPRKRRVTLQELIDQLQLIGSAIEERKARPRTRRTSSKARDQATRVIAELAHQENLVETASELERFLLDKLPQITEGWLEFDHLLELWSSALQFQAIGHEDQKQQMNVQVNSDRVGAFWALLLLSAQSKVELHQEEFYQDLNIRTIPSVAQEG